VTTKPIIHGSFTIDRTYPVPAAKVFAALAQPELKARWFAGPPGWTEYERRMDFRVGGEEKVEGRHPTGKVSCFTARYHEIVPNERVVYVYDMHIDGSHLSLSLATIELTPEGDGTKLRFTEHAAYLDGTDGNDARREGTAWLLEQIATFVTAS
jgi:uncharacterized protein YndB with AHSA1/START domain